MNILSKIIGMIALVSANNTFSMAEKEIYASITGGIVQANFNSNYWDQSDVIAQNISEAVLQNGYTGGIALGYNQRINPQFFLGGELSAHINSNKAQYQSGAATAAFSDSVKLKHSFDATVVSGITSNSSFIPYLKLGLSYANVSDTLITPVGYTPSITNYSTDTNRLGFAAGLGIRHFVNKNISLFSELNYHDYGTLQFHDFQNFTADYTHSARLCSYGVVIGAAYSLNV